MPLYPSLTILDQSAAAETIHSSPAETVLDGTCEVPVYKGGSMKKVTTQDIADLAGGGLPSQTGNGGKYLTTDGATTSWGTPAGSGDFVKAVDDTDDITVGTVNKFATAAEKTKLGFISVTQAVDLDTVESDIAGKAPALGSDDNYVTDAEKTKLANLSGTNTGDSASLPIGGGTLTGSLNLATGTASAGTAPAKLTAGTLLTTPEAGALELDANCFYGTTDAGNRGYIPVKHFIRCNATRTLPNDSNLNAIFNSPANGRLTLETGTYLFEAVIGIKSMSATSGNAAVDVLGAGTATIDDWLYAAIGKDGTLISVAAVLGTMPVIKNTPASMFTAGTGAEMWFTLKGTFTVTVAGTLIPSIDQVTGAAAVVAIGSYFSCERIGDTGVVSVGQWD